MPDIVVMFFVLGLVAGLIKSDLVVPKAAYDLLSLMLMLTIGLKGGFALYGEFRLSILPELLLLMLIGGLIPLILVPILRFGVQLSKANAISLSAHYGSVSAGTFAVALAYIQTHQLAVGAEVTLYLVALELPAIVVAVFLYRRHNKNSQSVVSSSVWHEAFANRGVVLLVGGLLIGYLYGPEQGVAVTGLLTQGFHVVLALFLLDMGLTAALSLRPFPKSSWRLALFALLIPFALAFVGLLVGKVLQLPEGSTLIIASLFASASYIAAPAIIRNVIPDADMGLAMFAALGMTFPMNVILGIPLYHQWLQWVY
ncbi:sodium-dependent bicarbonate transport family permease [Nitrincola tibetensis]|uniref:Sodium-dependent bicarbonate transport family permease n=1 Tax=Nitrincola tibetensis TaxID=2219697 RepID=A0A364NKR3_9GAMM|nr:sodium-dependent bicarbonate transport family permease [Nitrincola tibetensis]RAU17624.1 sodium-dependent bicarbonate transport family permease [Nitrincola tibetensis]